MRPQPQSLDRRALLQTLALAPLPAQASTALERPKDFTLGVSSFDVDGGHFSLELRPATNVAPASPDTDAVLYVQIALPLQFRASRMVKYGGELRDGYGAWSVGAPGGLPLRLLVGALAAS
jgi:hypothetical protein